MNGISKHVGCFLILFFARPAMAQLQVGDDVTMRMNGTLTGGYAADYGNQIPSDHNVTFGADAQLNGDYYNPNFLNFSVAPYYGRSTANSSFASLTDASGVNATVNLFSGSRFPAFASYNYTYNSTSSTGLVANPNFTTIGTGQGFGVGWSALLPNWPTFSVSYSQGSGGGNVFGTNEESSSSTKTLNLRSSYRLAAWNLTALYTRINIDSKIPYFLSGETQDELFNSSGNNFGLSGTRNLPWHGSLSLSYLYSEYSSDYESLFTDYSNQSSYSTSTETANVQFHPTAKLSLFGSQQYTNNLNGYFYQNLASSGSGVPLYPENSESNSSTLSGGASYTFLPHLYGTGQITYYDQTYLGHSYNGSYLTGTVGYNRRILQTFAVSASVVESTNKFANNELGFMADLNGYHRFGLWELSGDMTYAQNIQTILVTYTTSFYNYGAALHRRWGRTTQWTVAANGSHTGFNNEPGVVNHAESYSTTLSLRRLSLNANYTESSGQSILTSTGIQPIPPTPGLPPEGLIVYNGKSYGGSLTLTPLPRLSISGAYSHAVSDTLSNDVSSENKTEIFYSQLQYRLRRISLIAGFTKFSQGISASGFGTGNEYSYFVGVQRWFNFF